MSGHPGSGFNFQCPSYKGDTCGHFLVCSHICQYQSVGMTMCSLSLKESQLSFAQQFLSSEGMFEVDNYQNSRLGLDSCLLCWSLSNSGFVSNYL